MTLSMFQFLWLPPKLSTKPPYPKNIYFSRNPQKYWNSKFWTWPEPTYVWKYQSTPPPPPGALYTIRVYFTGGGGGGTTRGHSLKLFKRRSRLKIRSNSFRNRVVDTWNSLQEQIVQAPSLNCFKSRLNNWAQHFPGVQLFPGGGVQLSPIGVKSLRRNGR